MASEADKNGKDKTTATPSVGFTLPFAERAPANAVDVMVAATAAGMAISTQFASAFFGVMQAAMGGAAKRPASPSTTAEAPVAPEAPAVVSEAPVAVRADTPVADIAPVAVPSAPVASKSDRKAPAKVVSPKAAKVKAEKPQPVAAKAAEKAEKPAKVKAAPAKRAAKPATPVKAAAPEAVAPAVEAEAVVTSAPVEEKPAKARAKSAAVKAEKTDKGADDLKKISGIGPKLAEMLNGMGVTRYADIAGWTDTDMEHIDRELGLDGRIAKDDWIAQAKALQR